MCLESFIAESEEEVTVHEGDVVTVLACFDDGWWTVRVRGAEGLCSGDFLDPIVPAPAASKPPAPAPVVPQQQLPPPSQPVPQAVP